MEMERDASLPRLPRASGAYLATLLALVVVFYALLVASLVLSAYLLLRLILWTPVFLAQEHTLGALKLLVILYAALCVYAYAVFRGLSVKSGGDPGGIKLTRVRHPDAFALVHEVAARLQADPIDEIYVVPGTDIGVWEETALYLPPGTGKRKIILGMAALASLTPGELRGILAHEYAHFSHRDTFFSRFIYRADSSCGTLLAELRRHGGWVRYLNPLYWVLLLFSALYPRLAARFSRIREIHADRRAVEAYGRDLFARALITIHLEGSFFGQVGADGAIRTASCGGTLPNVYHFVAAARREYDRENPGGAVGVLSRQLAETSRRLDSHPSLRERLDAQNVPEEMRHPYPLPHLITTPALDALAGAEVSVASHEPSAAEALFGEEALTLQAELTTLYSVPFMILAHVLREAQGAEAQA